jgi:hypothetical protein
MTLLNKQRVSGASYLSRIQENKPDVLIPGLVGCSCNQQDQIAYPIEMIFECSIKTSTIPKDWKSGSFIRRARKAMFKIIDLSV